MKAYTSSLQSAKEYMNYKKNNYPKFTAMIASVNNMECKYCSAHGNKSFKCREFLKLSIRERL